MAMRGWWPNVSDSDRTLWANLWGAISFGCGFVLIFGLLILVGLFILFETTPNSSAKAGNFTMSIDEFASKDDLWKDLISGPVDPDLEIKMAEIQNWISKSSQKFDANSYFSKATRYVVTHGDAAGWTFDESISKESVDEMIKKINEEQSK